MAIINNDNCDEIMYALLYAMHRFIPRSIVNIGPNTIQYILSYGNNIIDINNYINIFIQAFNYIFIREMIHGAIQGNNENINELIDIHPDLNKIIQIIYGDEYGRELLRYFL